MIPPASVIGRRCEIASASNLIFLTAIMASLFVFALDRDLGKFVRNFGWAYFIVVIIMAPVSSVAVVDKLKQEPPKIVGNVPWLLAMGAFTTNFTTGWITKEYETLTSVPSSLSLTGTGDMGFGQALIRNTNKMSITSPSLRADIMQYIKECSIYDMQDGVLNAEDLMQKTDSWNKLFSNTNPARFVTLGILKGAPETVTCVEGATRLKQQVNDGIAAAMRYYGKNAFIDFNEATALSMYTNAVGTSYSWILGANQSASDAVKQSMFNNIMKDANTELPALINDQTRIQELMASAGAAAASEQMKGAAAVLSKLAFEVIPIVRNWLEVVLYATFPIAVMLIVLKPSTAVNILSGYFTSFLTLGLFPLIFALINHASMLYLRRKAEALDFSEGIPFTKMGVLDSTVVDIQTVIGLFVILTIPLAAWIARGFYGDIAAIGNQIVGRFTSAGSSIGSSMAMGNMTLGETNIDSSSVNNTSMNKYDSNLSQSRGLTTLTNEYGTSHTLTPSGVMNTQKLEDTTAQSLHTGQSISRSNENRYGQSTDSVYGVGATYDTATGSTNTNSYNRSETYGLTDERGVSNSSVTGVGNSKGYTTGTNQNESDTTHTGVSLSKTDYTAMSAGANGNLGLGGGAGSGGGGSEEKRVAGSPTNPGNVQPESKGEGGKGGKGGKAGVGIQAGVGVYAQGQKGINWSGTQDEGQNRTSAVDEYRGVSTGVNYRNDLEHNKHESQNETHTSSNGHERSASLYENNSYAENRNAQLSSRNEEARSTSFASSHSMESGYNYAQDPKFKKEVAQHFGLDQVQFSNLSPQQQTQYMQDYLANETARIKETPSTYADGKPIEFNLPSDFRSNKGNVGSRSGISADFAENSSNIGTGIKQVSVNTGPSSAISGVKNSLDDIEGNMSVIQQNQHNKTEHTKDRNFELEEKVGEWKRKDIKDTIDFDPIGHAKEAFTELKEKVMPKNETHINSNGASFGQWNRRDIDPKK